MTDYKKQAHEIVQGSFDGWLLTKPTGDPVDYLDNLADYLVIDIAQALERAAIPKVISDDAILKSAKDYADQTLYYEREAYIADVGFTHGARHVANLNLMRALDEVWPSVDEIKDIAKHQDSDGYFGFLNGCEWLKETLTARLK